MSDNWVVQNLQNSLSTWNEKLAEVWQLLTQSPENFKGGKIWDVILNINGAVQAVGLALLVLFFLVILLCSVLDVTQTILEFLQLFGLHLTDSLRHGVDVLLEVLIFGIQFYVDGFDVVLQVFAVCFHIGLHLLRFGHGHDDFLRVDAAEFLGEE